MRTLSFLKPTSIVWHASQIAIRSSIADGLKRPAAHVRAIVVTQSERNVPSRGLVRDLREFYPEARVLTLLGTCCEGMYAKVIDPVFTRSERLLLPSMAASLARLVANL